jgi:hypothetical protein
MKIQRLLLQGAFIGTFFSSVLAVAQTPPSLSDTDRSEIQALVAKYAQALGACRAEEFADLFAPQTGAFASTVRGRMMGREQLIKLVESERQCTAPAAAKGGAPKAGAARPAPTVQLEVTAVGVHGIATVTGAEYQDEYLKTPQGWRFASRTVLTTAEKNAGLDAAGLLAIQKLAGAKLADHYEPDQNGVSRLITSGVRVTVKGEEVTGKAYLADGSYDDQVYEKTGGQWRVKSSTHVAAGSR